MDEKVGRNDLCPCGSGKKYKQCCLLNIKPPATKRKLTAKWINKPEAPNLMERTFGNSISQAKTFTPLTDKEPRE
jgi:hypothetical protein